jgi:3-oxoacyl-[acyl-carrier protein] reductase
VNILTVATATGLTSEARMGVLAGKAALVTGGSRGPQGDRGAPDPDGAVVVLSFICNRTAAEQVAAAVETAGGRAPAMNLGEARASGCRGPE